MSVGYLEDGAVTRPAPGEELLPCPCCKSHALHVEESDEDEDEDEDSDEDCVYWVKCGEQLGVEYVVDGCGAEGPVANGRDGAIAAWNRRAEPATITREASGILGLVAGITQDGMNPCVIGVRFQTLHDAGKFVSAIYDTHFRRPVSQKGAA